MRTAALALTLLALLGGRATAQTRVGDFLYVPVTDAMSDRDLSYISTVALPDGGAAPDARLLWRCSGATIEVVLHAPDLAQRAGPIPVRWRFDSDPASDREAWRVSSLEPLAFAPESTIYPFSEIAAAARTVLIRAEDREGRRHDYRFSLTGLNNGLNRLGCARHLEVLGRRRSVALFERASLSAGQALEEGGIPRLVEEFPFVGHRTQRRYMASTERCWRTLWKVEEIVFFRGERDARAQGFAKGQGCGP